MRVKVIYKQVTIETEILAKQNQFCLRHNHFVVKVNTEDQG